MKIKFFTASKPSATHPKENQDAFFADDKNKTFGVFDGVGGVQHGSEAANWCAECFKREAGETGLEKAFESCHNLLNKKAKSTFGHEIATTATVLKISLKRTSALIIWGSVGDSRVYHFIEGHLTQVSTDDSLVTQAIEQGWINRQQAGKINEATSLKELSTTEKSLFEGRNIITQVMGIGETKLKIGKFGVKRGDLILLTTDGVHDNLVNKEIGQILKQNSKDPAESLVEAASRISKGRLLRAKPDDMTAVVVKLE